MAYEYEYPMFAYAADVVVTDKNRENFILICRSDSGKMAIPGGFVEINETALETAYREFEEECGVNLLNEGIELTSIGTMDAVDRDPRQRTIARIFLGEVEDILSLFSKCKPGDDATEVVLWNGNVDDEDWPFDHKKILEYVKRDYCFC